MVVMLIGTSIRKKLILLNKVEDAHTLWPVTVSPFLNMSYTFVQKYQVMYVVVHTALFIIKHSSNYEQ